jgi:hypothetical protein
VSEIAVSEVAVNINNNDDENAANNIEDKNHKLIGIFHLLFLRGNVFIKSIFISDKKILEIMPKRHLKY